MSWMNKILGALVMGAFIFIPSYAQNRQALDGYCEDGNQTVTTVGIVSTTKVQRSYPGCTVTVRDAGTLNLSTIFADAAGTPKANPFTASSSNGYWSFYANPGQYDAVLSGAGMITTTRGGLWVVAPASGDVSGPGSSTDNAIVRWDGTTGDVIQNSNVTIDDAGVFTFPTNVRQTFSPGATVAGLNVGSSASEPAAGTGGDQYYNTALSKFRCFQGGAWTDCIGSGGGGGGSPGGSSGNLQWNNVGTFAGVSGSAITSLGEVLLNNTARTTGGSTRGFAVRTSADTGLTSNTESIFGQLGGNSSATTVVRQFTFGPGDTLVQREWVAVAPTYAFTAGDVIAEASTFAITGAPIQGTNATINNSYALWVQSGLSKFSGKAQFTPSATLASLNVGAITGSDPSSPVNGDVYYNTTNNKFRCYENSSWVDCTGGGGSGNPGGTGTNIQYRINGTTFGGVAGSAVTTLGEVAFTNTQRTSGGSVRAFDINTPNDTGLTADTESILIEFGDATTRQFTAGGGTFTAQRNIVIGQPTYAFTSADTIVTAATFAIAGAPTEGANASITNKYALWVQQGKSQFLGNVEAVSPADATPAFSASGFILIDPDVSVTDNPMTLDIDSPDASNFTPTGEGVHINIDLLSNVSFAAAVGGVGDIHNVFVRTPFYSSPDALTISNAATMTVESEPQNNGNITFTNALAFWVYGGNMQLGRQSGATSLLQFANATNNNILSLSAGVTSTSYTLTFPLAAPGSTQCLQMANTGAITTTGAGCGGSGSPGGSNTQVQYNNSSAFGGITGFTSDGTNVTAGSANLRATRPRFTTSIDDANGNEVIALGSVASAVNELTISNNATGSDPFIAASGGDSNIQILMLLKGTGSLVAGQTHTATNTANRVFGVFVNSTGVAAAGFGQTWDAYLESSTTNDRLASQLSTSWTVATDGTRTSKLDVNLVNSASTVTALSVFPLTLGLAATAGNAPTADGNISYDTTKDAFVGGVSGATIELSLYDVAWSFASKPASSQVVMRHTAARAFKLPTGTITNGTNAPFVVGTAATAQTDWLLRKNGSTFCTYRFAASGTQATYLNCTLTDFAIGDVLTMQAPSSVDTTLADGAGTAPGLLK